MLTYPMSRAEYLFGKILFNVSVAVAQALMTLALAALALGVRIRWDLLPLLGLSVVGGTAGWFYFYAIFALRTRRNDIFNSITSIFYFFFLFASSMFYPLEALPGWLRLVGRANPMTWQVDLLRHSTIGWANRGSLLEAAGFTLFSLASFGYAVRCLRNQE